jgi:hypothetical protein
MHDGLVFYLALLRKPAAAIQFVLVAMRQHLKNQFSDHARGRIVAGVYFCVKVSS